MVTRPPMQTEPRARNKGGYAGTRKVEAVCWHITQGTDSLNWLARTSPDSSSNYLVARDGTIYELVPPDEDAWANGIANSPNTANPLVAGWIREGANFNQRTVSIEHEGFTSNYKGGSLTPAQVDATVALTAWLIARYRLPPDATHIIPHSAIDAVNRRYCPGFSAAEWAQWLGRVAALVGGEPALTWGRRWLRGGTFAERVGAA